MYTFPAIRGLLIPTKQSKLQPTRTIFTCKNIITIYVGYAVTYVQEPFLMQWTTSV